jgi:hypothetical protein
MLLSPARSGVVALTSFGAERASRLNRRWANFVPTRDRRLASKPRMSIVAPSGFRRVCAENKDMKVGDHSR